MDLLNFEFEERPKREPQKKHPGIRYAKVELCEGDFELINEAMRSLKVRCGQNATSAIANGYGSARSHDKAKSWKNKAEEIDDLLSRIATEMN